jgi:hypothetical protein
MTCQISVEWIDAGEEPRHPADPRHPDGVDVVAALPSLPSVKITLPYPARRCGAYRVTCTACLQRFSLTTAGRADDPRSVTIPCRAVYTPAKGRA